ncbi:T9SS type A sorting domain-containing protein, partial [candidate division WOR-3 bacterium]|nr:T9SS type A sorting domain-containing protein [candidate division WOR-3 bacterium]
ISYEIPRESMVALRIFDVSGRLVKTLWEGPKFAGTHTTTWNGMDNTGEIAPQGIYFCQLTGPKAVSTRKVVLIR